MNNSPLVVLYTIEDCSSEVFGPFTADADALEWIISKQLQGWKGQFFITEMESPLCETK